MSSFLLLVTMWEPRASSTVCTPVNSLWLCLSNAGPFGRAPMLSHLHVPTLQAKEILRQML